MSTIDLINTRWDAYTPSTEEPPRPLNLRWFWRTLLAVLDGIIVMRDCLSLGLSMLIVFLEWTHVLTKGKRRIVPTIGGIWIMVAITVTILDHMFYPR